MKNVVKVVENAEIFLEQNNLIRRIMLLLLFLFPLVLSLKALLIYNIPFWYDPARDFLSAWNNLSKPTFIGPPSGIPGFFYGPYWIWLISIGLLFTKDPRLSVFISLTVPYIILLPLFYYFLKKHFRFFTLIGIWILFATQFAVHYSITPWNPNVAPFFIILLIIVFAEVKRVPVQKKHFFLYFLIGAISALVINFHISLGIGVMLGTVLSMIIIFFLGLKDKKSRVKNNLLGLILYISGIVTVFLPFLLFEIRHGFNQVKVALQTLGADGAVVGVTGMSDSEIFQHFISPLAKLLTVNNILSLCLVVVILLITLIYLLKKKNNAYETNISIITFTIFLSTLVIYLSSKNPVWNYHFIGLEVLYLFLLMLCVNKHVIFRGALLLWSMVSVVLSFGIIISVTQPDPKVININKQKEVVQQIISDVRNSNYTVFAYNTSTYSYEYSYLFKWLAEKDVPYDPGTNNHKADTLYLILSHPEDPKQVDFIHFRAPDHRYKETKTWQVGPELFIFKREKI